jgi:hypothetical protein
MRNRTKFHSNKSLEFLCAITSVRLFFLLEEAGFSDVKLCVTEADDHAFIQCAGYVVDVTATQFPNNGYKAVEVVPVAQATDDLWQVGRSFKETEEMRRHFDHWPEMQQPRI